MISEGDFIDIPIEDDIFPEAYDIIYGIRGSGPLGEGRDYGSANARRNSFETPGERNSGVSKAVIQRLIKRPVVFGLRDGNKYDWLINGRTWANKTLSNRYDAPALNHRVTFEEYKLKNLLNVDNWIITSVCWDTENIPQRPHLTVCGVISENKLFEVARPMRRGETIGAGKQFEAAMTGLELEYSELDKFRLEELIDDKVATA